MAGEWLKFESSTPDKPEVFAITAAMGWDDPDLTVGKLLRVWRWFDQHTTDGNAACVTPALLDRVSGVTGFATAMQKAGWLIVTDGGVSLPNFDRNNGETAKKRALGAKRAANSRSKSVDSKDKSKSDDKSNAASVTGALPREEKKREDKKEGASAFVLPEWIPTDAWRGYEEMRVKAKKPMTNRARALVLTELGKLRDSGNDPAAVLDRSTVKGWTDVYPIKGAPANDDPYGLRTAL